MASPNSIANLFIAPAKIYTAPENTAQPADDAAIAAPWVNLGWLKEGVEVQLSKNVYELTPDQFVVPLLVQVTGIDYVFRTMLDEIIMTNMPTIYGLGSTVVTAAGSGQIGKETFKVAAGVQTLPVRAYLIEGIDHNGFYTRASMWRAVSIASISLAMRKGAEMSIPAEFKALAEPSQAGQELGIIIRKTAAAL